MLRLERNCVTRCRESSSAGAPGSPASGAGRKGCYFSGSRSRTTSRIDSDLIMEPAVTWDPTRCPPSVPGVLPDMAKTSLSEPLHGT
eukprot:12060488-Heterocapsa_arctica.AAC.1